MFGKNKEYDEVVKANNKLRIAMEKMRLENALLKDQVRALTNLTPELSSIYVFVQDNNNASIAEVKASPKFSGVGEADLASRMESLVQGGLFEKRERDNTVYYSIKTPDISESYAPKSGSVISAWAPKKETKDLDDPTWKP